MSAHLHTFDLSEATILPPGEITGRDATTLVDLHTRWEAVHEAANAVAAQAQLAREKSVDAINSLPARACAAGGERLRLVETALGDLTAIMQIGLRALLGAAGQGRDTTAAALTLWREFHSARGAILALVEPEMQVA